MTRLTFTDRSGRTIEARVQPSLVHTKSVYLELNHGPEHVGAHISVDDADKLITDLQEVIDGLPKETTYRGVVVPENQLWHGQPRESFKAGVDAALDTARATVAADVCGKVRNYVSEHWDTKDFPCVRHVGHFGFCKDMDDDSFEGVDEQ